MTEPDEVKPPVTEPVETTPPADAEPEASDAVAAQPAEPPIAAEDVDAAAERARAAEAANTAAVEAEVRRLSRRGFAIAGVTAIAAAAGWSWLRARPREGDVAWPFRRMLRFNEWLALAYFRGSRITPALPRSAITRPARINGGLGLNAAYDTSAWRLRIEGAARPVELTMDDIRALPRHEQITEFRCIEGWSTVTQWAGARLTDLIERYPPPSRVRYVALETPDRAYYVGLDMASAHHPQTLLAYELNGAPLTWQHGSPLRLAIPVKYGVKNIKRIGTIRYTDVRPADYWGERGYDWYAGL